MSDYDDMMNDYDWYQNTGELRENFEDDDPDYNQGDNNPQSDGGTSTGCLIASVIVLIIGLIVWVI